MLSLKLGIVYGTHFEFRNFTVFKTRSQYVTLFWPRTQSPNLSFSNAVDTVCATTPDHCLEIVVDYTSEQIRPDFVSLVKFH